MFESLPLLWAICFPFRGGSAAKQASRRVSALKKQSRLNSRYQSSQVYQIVNWIDDVRFQIIGLFLGSLVVTLCLANFSGLIYFNVFDLTAYVEQGHIWTSCPELKKCPTGDNFHAIIASIQATVLSIIIPITIAMHDLVLKGRHLRDEMIGFTLRETRVQLITQSSIIFLIWVGFIEVLKVNQPDLGQSIYTPIIEAIWVALNLGLIGYFMQTAILLLNRRNFDAAIRRFTIRDAYPAELRRLIQRNLHHNISRINRN